MRHGRLLAGSLVALLSTPAAAADQILKFWEEGVRKNGKPYESSATLRCAAAGVRVDIVETDKGDKPFTMSFVYIAAEDRIASIEPPGGPAITHALLDQLEARARKSGHKRKPGTFTVTPLHTTHAVGKWTTSAWAVRRPGQRTEIVYLADPGAIGLEDATRRNLKKMGDLFVGFINRTKLIRGEDLRESFNTSGLEQGFPVREFRAGDGAVEMDNQLVSVENVELPADLFKAPAAPARDTAPTPDHSLAPDAYVALGLPTPERTWTGEEYNRAAEVLERAAAGDASRLPRLESETSGAVFRRFVNPDNLDITTSPTLSPQQRLQFGGGLAIGVGKVLNVYASAAQKGARMDAELAELMSFTLLVTRRVVIQAEEFFASLPADDPDRAARLEGRRKMRDGFATVVSSCLESLAESEGLPPAARLRIARSLEENLPPVLRYLPEGMRQELLVKLARMREVEADPALRESLDSLDGTLRKGRPRVAT